MKTVQLRLHILGLARTVYMGCIVDNWQGNHQIWGHIKYTMHRYCSGQPYTIHTSVGGLRVCTGREGDVGCAGSDRT